MTGNQIGVNEKSVFTLSSITDINEHDLPDTDGDDKASAQDPYDVRTADRAGAIITNHGDQALTARLERAGALDENFGREFDDESGVAVPAGETKAIVFDTGIPLAFARVVISFDSAPSSADPSVTVEYNADHNG